jgi:hypothetical protein
MTPLAITGGTDVVKIDAPCEIQPATGPARITEIDQQFWRSDERYLGPGSTLPVSTTDTFHQPLAHERGAVCF